MADRFIADGVELVSGNQGDIDLIVAWTSDDGDPVVVFIKAKAYSPWTNKQVGHKVPRLTAIVDSAISVGLTFTPRLVLAGPTPRSQGLDVLGWPAWGQRDGQPLFLQLPIAGSRLSVERVDEGGSLPVPARSGRSSVCDCRTVCQPSVRIRSCLLTIGGAAVAGRAGRSIPSLYR